MLYLNNNRIRSIRNLSTNFRLNFLDLGNNKISTLVGSDLPCLRNLETLILRGNEVGDIVTQTKVLEVNTIPWGTFVCVTVYVKTLDTGT